MYIETRFYDNGQAQAKLHKEYNAPQVETSDSFDTYVEICESLQAWIEENLEIELDDVVDFVLELESGSWVDISAYC